VCGGIQHRIWRKTFGGDDELYLHDGTIYRLLVVAEKSKYFELTTEVWTDQDRAIWEKILYAAMEWADQWTFHDGWQPIQMIFEERAQKHFFEWRNELFTDMGDLPNHIHGYLPKAVDYAARLAGILSLMESFSHGHNPNNVLTMNEVERGIRLSEFYLGHAVDAIGGIVNDSHQMGIDIDDRVIRLADSLNVMRDQTEDGRLSVGFITKLYNRDQPQAIQVKPRGMGALLRECGLTVPARKFGFHGVRGMKCLLWDKKTESFIDNVLNVPDIPRSTNKEG
jgi:hypothetical protein